MDGRRINTIINRLLFRVVAMELKVVTLRNTKNVRRRSWKHHGRFHCKLVNFLFGFFSRPDPLPNPPSLHINAVFRASLKSKSKEESNRDFRKDMLERSIDHADYRVFPRWCSYIEDKTNLTKVLFEHDAVAVTAAAALIDRIQLRFD